MQGAKISKIMFPYGCRVHFFKIFLFEQFSTNQKNDAKNPFIKSAKNDAKKHRKSYPEYAKLSDLGSHFGASC